MDTTELRTILAGMAMQGLLSYTTAGLPADVASDAVEYADALLAALKGDDK